MSSPKARLFVSPPFEIRIVHFGSAHMAFLTRTISLPIVCILLAGFTCPSAESPGSTSAEEEAVLERFKLARDSKILLLPIEIQGKKYSFVLDTGSTLTNYDTSLGSYLGDPVLSATMHTSAGEKKMTLFRPPAAKLGRLDLSKDSPVTCIDLRRFREVLKEEIYGVIGMDFLKEHVFRVDFDSAEVVFLRSVGPDAGVRVPVTYNKNVPQVEVTFPGLEKREKFQVDTGHVGISGGHLREETFDDLAKLEFLKTVGDAKFETISGQGSSKKGRVNAISLGDFRQKNLLFTRSKRSLLCLDYWSEYDAITFDFPDNAIYLKKKRHPDRSDDPKK